MDGLVLTRKRGQKIDIGDDIVIELVEIQPGRVRVRIEAPKHVAVYRSEIPHAERRQGWRKEVRA